MRYRNDDDAKSLLELSQSLEKQLDAEHIRKNKESKDKKEGSKKIKDA